MFKRREKESTAEDAMSSIAPWEMLDEAQIALQTARLQNRLPGRTLIPIARRLDTDAVACFDKGPDGTSKAVLVVTDLDGPTLPVETHYPGFSAWFDTALADGQRG